MVLECALLPSRIREFSGQRVSSLHSLQLRKRFDSRRDVIFKHLTNFCVLVWVKRLATDFKSTDFQWIPSQMGNFTLNVPTYLDAFL